MQRAYQPPCIFDFSHGLHFERWKFIRNFVFKPIKLGKKFIDWFCSFSCSWTLPHNDIIFIFNVDRVYTTGRSPLALGACVCFFCRTLAYLGATASYNLFEFNRFCPDVDRIALAHTYTAFPFCPSTSRLSMWMQFQPGRMEMYQHLMPTKTLQKL